MADKLQIRAGNKEGVPSLADREIAYVRDENALYIGTPGGNKKVEPTIPKAAAQAELDAEADTYALVDAFNSLVAALKDCGLMEK